MNLEAVAIVDEAAAATLGRRVDERLDEYIRVSLPLTSVCDRGGVDVRQVAVWRVVEAPPPEAVQDTDGLRV
jgi:hypothetical protein